MGNPLPSSSSSLRFGRRRIFHALLGELRTAMEELQGIRHFRLEQLADLSDRSLAEVIPTWRRSGRVRVLENRLVNCERDGSVAGILLELSETQRRLLALFDGSRSLARIADEWAAQSGLSPPDAFVQVKHFWLPFAELGILVPQRSFVPEGEG
jgi:hypothetical protein